MCQPAAPFHIHSNLYPSLSSSLCLACSPKRLNRTEKAPLPGQYPSGPTPEAPPGLEVHPAPPQPLFYPSGDPWASAQVGQGTVKAPSGTPEWVLGEDRTHLDVGDGPTGVAVDRLTRLPTPGDRSADVTPHMVAEVCKLMVRLNWGFSPTPAKRSVQTAPPVLPVPSTIPLKQPALVTPQPPPTAAVAQSHHHTTLAASSTSSEATPRLQQFAVVEYHPAPPAGAQGALQWAPIAPPPVPQQLSASPDTRR